MKKLLLILIMLAAMAAGAQNSITCKNGLVVRGKITEITSERITIQYDSTHKKSFSIADVTKYYDGKNTIRARSLKQTKTYDPYNASAGDELIKAANVYYSGFTISIIGVGIAAVGATKSRTTVNPLVYLGGGVALLGTIINVTAFGNIAKAGRKLNAISGKDGLGVSMKF